MLMAETSRNIAAVFYADAAAYAAGMFIACVMRFPGSEREEDQWRFIDRNECTFKLEDNLLIYVLLACWHKHC